MIIINFIQTLKLPKIPPNQARLVITPESSLEFGQVLGSGAFGTVYEVHNISPQCMHKGCVLCVCVCVCVCVCACVRACVSIIH